VYKEYYRRQRRRIFELFWSLESYVRKKDFVIPRVEEKKTRKYVSQNSEEEQKRKRDRFTLWG
jgi:hypothetical protein